MRKTLKRIKRWILRQATRLLIHAGMAIVDAEDWDTILRTDQEIYWYVRSSGHINNCNKGGKRCAKKLKALTQLVFEHTRFDPIVAEIGDGTRR